MLRGISSLPAISAPIDRLRQELQQNNVQPGQEAQYFEGKGRPLDPTLLALIKMNQMERAGQPRQQPVMGTVLQDKIQAAMQQAQPQPLPPPAVMQQMAARQAQMQQAQAQQAGIAPLPFNNPGYARGGIVAFEPGGPVENDDDVMDEKAGDYLSSEQGRLQDAADTATAAKSMFGVPQSKLEWKRAMGITPESLKLQDKDLIQLEKDEAERRAKAEDKRLGGMTKRQAMDYGIAEAAFGALGQKNPWETLRVLGTGAIKNKREVESLYRDAEEKKAEAVYNLKHAELLRNAGYVKEADRQRNEAIKNAIAFRKSELEADKIAKGKAPTGSAGAQYFARRQELIEKLGGLAPDSDEYKKFQKRLTDLDNWAASDTGKNVLAASVQAAGIGAASRERVAAASNAARIEVAHIMTDFKNSKMSQDQALKAIEAQRKIKTDRLYGGMLANSTPEQNAQLMAELELLDNAAAAIRAGQPSQSAAAPAPSAPWAAGASGAPAPFRVAPAAPSGNMQDPLGIRKK